MQDTNNQSNDDNKGKDGEMAGSSTQEQYEQPIVEIEPATMGQAVTSIKPNVVARGHTVTEPAEDKHKRHLWRTVAIVIASISLVTIACLAGFYLFYRTPNSAYDSLLKDLYSMREDAKIIPTSARELGDLSNIPNGASKVDASKKYIASVANVKKSSVLDKDNVVRRTYDSDKTVIEAYGQSSLDMLNSLDIYSRVDSTCKEALNDLSGVFSVREFDEYIAPCEKLLAKYPNVPLASFDESFYRRVISAYKDYIVACRSVYRAYENNDSTAMTSARSELAKASAVYTLATSGSPKVSNTANPTDVINRIIAAVEARKKIFFRH